MKTITETQKAYLAGFIDADGCISMAKYKGKANRTPNYTISLIVSQKRRNILDMFREWTSIGTVYESNIKQYSWRIPTTDAVKLLENILPYLNGKKEQGEVALSYHKEFGGRQHHGGKGYTVPLEVVAKKEAYYLKLKELKKVS